MPSPRSPSPQHLTVEFVRTAQLCRWPTATLVTAERLLTTAGSELCPLPSWPSLLEPQHSTVAFVSTTQEASVPLESAVTPDTPATATGVGLLLVCGPPPS